MKIEFEVGYLEQHKVFFSFNKFWGGVVIKVDGKKIIGDLRTISFSLTKAYQFRVGSKEFHEVKIEKIRPLLFAGFRSNDYKVYVDGVLVKECRD
jgi:hypothetical protein